MARTTGARNSDFEQRRGELLQRARARLALQSGEPPSFRELALATGVSVPTLRHYFGSREGLIKALFSYYLQEGQHHLARARSAEAEGLDLEPALKVFLQRIVRGWTQGFVGTLHRIGLSEGLRNPGTALDYLLDVLEPTLQALEVRLQSYVERGLITECRPRHAALMLISPLLMALLHQHDLGGTRCRPLSLDDFVDEHVKVFLRAYRATAPSDCVPVAH